jgi:23S rRNA pseudouridine2604 synthase
MGQWRELTSEELSEINKMVASSSKTEEASVDDKKIKKQSVKKPSRKPTNFNKKSASFRKNSSKSKRSSGSKSRNRRR